MFVEIPVNQTSNGHYIVLIMLHRHDVREFHVATHILALDF